MSAGRPALRLGTRGSKLALVQAGLLADELRARGAAVELVVIRTEGDERSPSVVWGEGAFVVALEEALLDERIDVAVHSAKDVPTAENPRLTIAAYLPREDPRDALVCREPGKTLATLPPGATVGTDSPRRAAFVRSRRPDLVTQPLHGNVDTRLRKLAAAEADAIVLAVAGLRRLGLGERITEVLPAAEFLPAPGQGALAVQVRAGDAAAGPLVERLDDPATRAAVEAERAFLRASGGGCRAPLGALAEVEGAIITIRGAAADEGSVPLGDAPATGAGAAPGATFTARAAAHLPAPRVVRGERRGPVADRLALAAALARDLATALGRGGPSAAAGVAAAGGSAAASVAAAGGSPAASPRVLVTREPGRPGALARALAARGLEPVVAPTVELRPVETGGPLDEAAAALSRYAWVVVTSAAGAAALADAAARAGTSLAEARLAAVGGATAGELARRGGRVEFVPSRATGAALAAELPFDGGQRILLARADAAGEALPAALRARGALVEEAVAYQTVEAPGASRRAVEQALSTGVAAIAFTSGSTIRGLLALLGPGEREAALRTPACCIGPTTAAAARSAGFAHVVEAGASTVEALVDLVAATCAGARASGPIEPQPQEVHR
jgi:hydroxymethylbilane synthase